MSIAGRSMAGDGGRLYIQILRVDLDLSIGIICFTEMHIDMCIIIRMS